MSIFNIFSSKNDDGSISTIIKNIGLSDPVWTPHKYLKMAKEAYKQNGWVYACVDAIAKASKGVPLKLKRIDSEGGSQSVKQHEILDLLSHPNNEEGQGEFIESVFSYWMIAGNSYIQRVPTSGTPNELHSLRPDRVEPLTNNKNRITGYRYTVDGSETKISKEDLLHLRLFNPTGDHYGMSPLQAVAKTVDQHNSATEWNAALLQNYGKVSGAFIAEGRLDDEQFERMKGELRDEYGGAENAGELALLEGDVDFQKLSTDPSDMDWLEGMDNSAKIIHGAFGVPPEITGLGQATYENRKEAKKALYSETVLPLFDHFLDELNYWLVDFYDENVQLTYDKEDIPALTEDEKQKWERLRKNNFLTVNERREAAGYEPIEDGDYIPVQNEAQELPETPEEENNSGG